MNAASLHFSIPPSLCCSFSDTPEEIDRKASAAAAIALSSLAALSPSTPIFSSLTTLPLTSPPPLSSLTLPRFRGRFTKVFFNHIYSAPSSHPLFHLIFSFISAQFFAKEESNLQLTRDFLKSLSLTDPTQRTILLKKTLLDFKEKGTPRSPDLVAREFTPSLVEELSEVLGESPSSPASEFFSFATITDEEKALYYLVERSLTIYQIYKFTLLTLQDNDNYREVHSISTELIKLLLPMIRNLGNPATNPFDSVIRDLIEESKKSYTTIIEENATHILVNSGRITDLFTIKVELLEKSLTPPEALERLLPYEDYLLGHTDTALHYLRPMIESIKNKLLLMYKLVVFRFVVRDINCKTKDDVLRGIQTYMQPSCFAKLVKDLKPDERKLYAHYAKLKIYLKQIEDLIALFSKTSPEEGYYSKIVKERFKDLSRPPPSPPKKASIIPARPAKGASSSPTLPLEDKPSLSAEPKELPLLTPLIEAPTDLLGCTPDLSSLTGYGSKEALQIAFKYAASLFKLKAIINQANDPIQLSHLYLDLLIAGHYCAEQSATACLAIPSREAFDHMIATRGHSLARRFSIAGLLDLSGIDGFLANFEGVEYHIRDMPFSSRSHPTLNPWSLLRQASSETQIRSLKEEMLRILSDTLRVFFITIKTLPSIKSLINEDQLELFLSEDLYPLKEMVDTATDSLPQPLLTALKHLEAIKSHLLAKQSGPPTFLTKTLCFKIERLHHALLHFKNPHLIDFMFTQFRLVEIELLETALSLGQHLGKEEAHDLLVLATELGLDSLTPSEIAFLKTAKGVRVVSRYTEMSHPIIKKKPTFLESPLLDHSKEASSSEEGFIIKKSARQTSAEKELSLELPLICSILEKALIKRDCI